MAFCIQCSMPSFMSAFLLLSIFIYAEAVILTQASAEFLNDKHEEDHPSLRQYWGSLSQSFYSLGMSISGGQDWGDLAEPLRQLHWSVFLCFLAFISVTILCVMNVILGVFVDAALQTTQYYKDLMVV